MTTAAWIVAGIIVYVLGVCALGWVIDRLTNGPPRTAESVARELVEGLEDGSIVLDGESEGSP